MTNAQIRELCRVTKVEYTGSRLVGGLQKRWADSLNNSLKKSLDAGQVE